MKIGIVGAGKVGSSIGKYLQDSSRVLNGYYSRTNESAQLAADFTDSRMYDHLEDLLSTSDTLFVTTPDGEIGKIWDCIVKVLERKQQPGRQIKYICHFSGSLSSDLFSNREQWNIQACSIHPMYAFSSREKSYLKLNQAVFTAEGDAEAIEMIGGLFRKKGNAVCRISTEDKMKYHAAAAVLSNMNIALISMGLNLLSDCGFSKEEAMRVAAPLVRNNIADTLQNGVVSALTGPVERNDAETVKKHLSILEGDVHKVYVALAKELVRLSGQKYPERDYSSLQNILTEAEKFMNGDKERNRI